MRLFIYILIQYSLTEGQKQKERIDTSTRAPDYEEKLFDQLSPEAFFAMKDSELQFGSGSPLLGPIGPSMGSIGPGMGSNRPGMGPNRPGMGPIGPGMGPNGPDMGALPGRGTGMRPGPGRPGMRPARPDRPVGPMPPRMPPSKQPVKRPMRPGVEIPEGNVNYGKKDYEHFDLSTLDDMSRQSGLYQENYGLEYHWTHTTAHKLLLYNLCFCLTYIWRRGRLSIRKYFHSRDIYYNHLMFELGYITQVIMSKYQTMLELYEYSRSLVKRKKGVSITRMHLTQFQRTMDMDATSIVHLCNMMHELKAKYESQPYDPANRFAIPPATPNISMTTAGTTTPSDYIDDGVHRHGKPIDKAYLSKKIAESHKEIDKKMSERKKKMKSAREHFKKYGYFPTSPRTEQPMRLWSPNLDYRFSGEDEWN